MSNPLISKDPILIRQRYYLEGTQLRPHQIKSFLDEITSLENFVDAICADDKIVFDVSRFETTVEWLERQANINLENQTKISLRDSLKTLIVSKQSIERQQEIINQKIKEIEAKLET